MNDDKEVEELNSRDGLSKKLFKITKSLFDKEASKKSIRRDINNSVDDF